MKIFREKILGTYSNMGQIIDPMIKFSATVPGGDYPDCQSTSAPTNSLVAEQTSSPPNHVFD